MEYDRVEPFGDYRANWHAALIAHIIATAFTSKRRKPPDLRDFMWKSEDERQASNIAEADSFFFTRKPNGRSR